MRQFLLLLCITSALGKGSAGSRGGRSSGFGGGGTSKPTTIRGSTHDSQSGYRRHYYIFYYVILVNSHTHRKGYLYSNDPGQIEGEPPFDCGNGIHIRENQVCDWIDDCGNGVDERVPLPCEGKPSLKEIELYFTMLAFYFIWICVLMVLTRYTPPEENNAENKRLIHNYNMMISPCILFFINLIFLIALGFENKSIIIEYYITNCVFIAFGGLIAICIPNNINRIVWFILFIMTIVTIFHGSIYFTYIPERLLEQKTYTILNTPTQYPNYSSSNTSLYNIQQREGFWISEYANTSNFTIHFNQTIQLIMVQFFATYPNKTTDQFKLKGQTRETPWTTLINGPMPQISVKSAFEIIISDDGLPIDRLQFIASPIPDCNKTTQFCYPGLDELRVFGIKTAN